MPYYTRFHGFVGPFWRHHGGALQSILGPTQTFAFWLSRFFGTKPRTAGKKGGVK